MRFLIFLTGILAMVLAGQARGGETTADFTLFCAELPPYVETIPARGAATGVAVDILGEAMAAAGLTATAPPPDMPWRRAQETARTTPGGLVFPLARTAEREDKFQWVAVLVDDALFAYTRTADPVMDRVEELRQTSGPIGVLAGGVTEAFARREGLADHAEMVATLPQNFEKLVKGRVTVVISNGMMGAWSVRQMGLSGSVRHGAALAQVPMWIATSPATPEPMVAALRKAVEEFRKTPRYRAILARYS